MLREVPLAPDNRRVTIRVLDRPMPEIIGNDGRVDITNQCRSHGGISSVSVFATGGKAVLERLDVRELESMWQSER